MPSLPTLARLGVLLSLAAAGCSSKGKYVTEPMRVEILPQDPTCNGKAVRLTYVNFPVRYEQKCSPIVIAHLEKPGTPPVVDVKFYLGRLHGQKAYNICAIHGLAAPQKDPDDGFTCVYDATSGSSGLRDCQATDPGCKTSQFDGRW